MTERRIARAWIEMEKSLDLCCDQHREAFRVIFFSGAMTALTELTNWDPEHPGILTVTPRDLAEVSQELTAVYHHENEQVCH